MKTSRGLTPFALVLLYYMARECGVTIGLEALPREPEGT
jgi:hypothetical protein